MTAALLHLSPLLGENSLFKAIGDIFHPLFVAVAAILSAIYSVVPNYAIAIAILTILIMAALTPLTIKSTRSMAAMQSLQPEMQKLRQKYKGQENREQLNQEMMRLYRESGVSPMGGCLPSLLQAPALIVLYDVIRGLTNTIKLHTKFPKGTVLASGHIASGITKCTTQIATKVGHTLVCAVPRYIPTGSKMYHNLLSTPGVMKAFGLNLALKPFTHQPNWYGYVPYIGMVVVAIALQYVQMAQMTKRSQSSGAQVNPQMQTMQRVMPLIFGLIYLRVPSGVEVYMIVSSAIRILTQDQIFRHNLVPKPGERVIGAGPKKEGWFTRLAAQAQPQAAANGRSAGEPAPGIDQWI